MLEILQEHDAVTEEQVEHARSQHEIDHVSIVEHLIRDEIFEEADILGVLASHFGMEMVSLIGVELAPEVRDLIPAEMARRYRAVPLYNIDGSVTVAISDPLDFDALDSLRYLLKCNVVGVITTNAEIKMVLDKYYAGEAAVDALLDTIEDGTVDVSTVGEDLAADGSDTESDAPIIKLVSLIILEAFKHRASDIHLEPMEKRFRVRYRIDGVLHEVDSPPKRLQSAIISRIKIMSAMKISEKRAPQDGRIQVNIMGRELDLRVSTVPSNHGETIVMRILDKQNLALGLAKLGFFSDDQQMFERLVALPDGILLVTGPTGSGKTTTLYACLQYINRPDRKIITVEDPVEYQMSGINQVQVRVDIGFTFSAALRAILRQAPNIVMIGEIRDEATANIATEAALTGHLVFSTLHTNDAPSAVTRLLDIGVKPFLVASSVRAIMAQRLVRCICEHCKEVYEPLPSDIQGLGPAGASLADVELVRGRGCTKCSLSGYHSRKGLFEMFEINDEIQKMIFEKTGANALRIRAREMGMRTLREDGVRKIGAGITTIEEVMRVTMGDLD